MKKHTTLLLSAIIGIFALGLAAPSAQADWSFFGHHFGHHRDYNRHYHHGYRRGGVVVVTPPVPVYTNRVVVHRYHRNSLQVNVQAALRRLGYYHGRLDGAIGRGSRRAIRGYQRDHRLAVTGTITRGLLRSLGIRR